MKLLEKLKDQVKENIKNSGTKKEKLLFKFEAKHYKEKMSTTQGFGCTDLRPVYYQLYAFLMAKYGTKGKTIVIKPGDLSKKEVVVSYK